MLKPLRRTRFPKRKYNHVHVVKHMTDLLNLAAELKSMQVDMDTLIRDLHNYGRWSSEAIKRTFKEAGHLSIWQNNEFVETKVQFTGKEPLPTIKKKFHHA